MRRLAALLLALMLSAGVIPASAEELSPEDETAKTVMEQLFLGCIGTDEETEKAARKHAGKEEQEARNEENLLYRETVVPWLTEALRPEEEGTSEPLLTWNEPLEEEEEVHLAGISVQNEEGTAQPEEKALTLEELEQRTRLEAAWKALSENPFGQGYVAYLQSLGAEGPEACMALTRSWVARWMEQIDAEKLKALNEDYTFWLYSAGTYLDYPVVQGPDNDYYLHRMFDRREKAAGTLFMDFRNLPDLRDSNTLVYGHHMRTGQMFGQLVYYKEQAYYEAHPYMLVIGDGEIDLVELFAGYLTRPDDHCYDIAISDEDDMAEYVSKALQKSDFVHWIEPQPGDRLLTLSTCAYSFLNARYIVIGRLNRVWQREDPLFSVPVAPTEEIKIPE